MVCSASVWNLFISISPETDYNGGIRMHLYSRALYLHGSPKWSYPCFRCHVLHRSPDSLDTHGTKCIEWREEYSSLNCDEPIAIVMVLKFGWDEYLYKSVSVGTSWGCIPNWYLYPVIWSYHVELDFLQYQSRCYSLLVYPFPFNLVYGLS